MREFDEERIIVVDRGSGGFGSFVWGLLLGAGAALLFAPKSGQETRDELRDRLDQLKEGAEGRVKEVRDTLTDTVDDVRRQVNEGVDSARKAIDSGRAAARAGREEMEDRLRESAAAFKGGWSAAREAEPAAESAEAHEPATEATDDDTEA